VVVSLPVCPALWAPRLALYIDSVFVHHQHMLPLIPFVK
jgi:hypothetical protein